MGVVPFRLWRRMAEALDEGKWWAILFVVIGFLLLLFVFSAPLFLKFR